MEWVRENWVFLTILIFFIAMHLFGFGCCGGHGRHGRRNDDERKGHSEGETTEKGEKKGGHGCC